MNPQTSPSSPESHIFDSLIQILPDSNGFIWLILIAATLAVAGEMYATYHYRQKQCSQPATAIQHLKQYRRFPQNGIPLNETMRGWFWRHFDGKIRGDLFFPKETNHRFVMLAFPSILTKNIPRSPVYFAPTLLTALGVLGTFTGIYKGLVGVGLDKIDTSNHLVIASTELLAGMKVAFSSSLWGLGTAIGLMLVLAAGERSRKAYRDRLRRELQKLTILETPTKILSNLDRNSNQVITEQLQQVTQHLTGLQTFNPEAIGQAVATSMRSELEITARAIAQQTAQQLHPSFQQISDELVASRSESLHPILVSISQELSTIRSQQEQQTQAVDYLIQQLRQEIIEPVIQRLDESTKLTKEASHAVKELKDSLGSIAENLSEAIVTIQNFQNQTLVELQEFARDLEQILSQQTQEQQEMLSGLTKHTELILEDANQAFSSQSEQLETIGNQASKIIESASSNLQSTLTNIDDQLQKTRHTVQTELDKFRQAYQTSLIQFFEDQNNLLESTLGKQKEGLEQVVQQLQQILIDDTPAMKEAIEQSMNSIQNTAESVYKLETETGSTSAERLQELQKVVRNMGNEAQKIEHAYQNLANQFHQALQASNEQFWEYLEQVNATCTNNIQEVDRSTADFCNQLHETSYGLMNAANRLVAAADQLSDRDNRS